MANNETIITYTKDGIFRGTSLESVVDQVPPYYNNIFSWIGADARAKIVQSGTTLTSMNDLVHPTVNVTNALLGGSITLATYNNRRIIKIVNDRLNINLNGGSKISITDMTIFFVYNHINSVIPFCCVTGNACQANFYLSNGNDSANTTSGTVEIETGCAYDANASLSGIADDGWKLITVRSGTNLSNIQIWDRKTKATMSLVSGDFTLTPGTTSTLGCYGQNTGIAGNAATAPGNGTLDLGDFMVYDDILTDNQISDVQDWLIDRWGI